MFFRHFIAKDCELMSLDGRNRAIRLMVVSKGFLVAAQETLRYSTVSIRLATIHVDCPNIWIFHNFKTAFLTEKTACAVIKLARPMIKKLIAMQYSGTPVKEIDSTVIPFLIGVPVYEIWNNEEFDDYPTKLAKTLGADGHLKMLDCKLQNVITGQGLEPLRAEHYLGEYDIYESPCDFEKLLHHNFRQIRLRMHCTAEVSDNYEDQHHHRYHWAMVTFGKTEIVQPAIEEIYLENLADRFQVDEPLFLPLNFYKHVPNLKKLFYSTHQSAVNYYYGESPSQALHKLGNFLDFMFKHVEQVLQTGTQTQFVFAINTTVFLNNNQSENNWMEELVGSSVFANMKCELVTESEMINRPDFQDTPTYHRFHCKSSTKPALICTGQNMKMFLWARFDLLAQVQNLFFDNFMDTDYYEIWEDDLFWPNEWDYEMDF
ncbi:hypothetical protein M3Y94_01004200 [Aphelenchoides besseyi]|nr:hypothetical protein M3Y94_01004200 [Aphelenchoides besseyi]